jgi:hypothetical protein
MSERGPEIENLPKMAPEEVEPNRVEGHKEPTKIIEIDGKKFELGPNLGELTWDDMNEKIAELNKTLANGEKPWRVFTREEYYELERRINSILNNKGLSAEERSTKSNEFIISLGFESGKRYWSSTKYIDKNSACYWGTDDGSISGVDKGFKLSVKVVREV